MNCFIIGLLVRMGYLIIEGNLLGTMVYVFLLVVSIVFIMFVKDEEE